MTFKNLIKRQTLEENIRLTVIEGLLLFRDLING